MLHGAKLKTALAKVKLISVHGPWSRIVGFRHVLKTPKGMKGVPQLLWGGAAKIKGARAHAEGWF